MGCYFQRRKALAYGVAMSGSGIGTFVLAPVVQMLIQLYSWRGALLVLSGFVANLCVCGALLRPIALQEEQCGRCSRQSHVPSVGQSESDSPVYSGAGDVSQQDVDKPPKDSVDLLAPPLPPGSSAPRLRRMWRLLSCGEYRFLLLPDFLGLAGSFLFLASGCSLPFVYLVPYALSVGVSHQHAAFLMSILGVIDIMGNITFGWLTDRRCGKCE